jgi:protein FRG1
MLRHGGYWKVKTFDEITGHISIEFGNKTYIKALDNGKFILGPPHGDGEVPDPEEILTAIKVNETKIALKSGYGKFLSLEKDNTITGRAEAVGTMEQFEPIFQDDKDGIEMAILCANQCFMAIDPEDDELVAVRRKVGTAEIAVIRSSASREKNTDDDGVPSEEKADLSQVEINYV